MYVCSVNHAGAILVHRHMTAAPAPFRKAVAPDRDGLVVAVDWTRHLVRAGCSLRSSGDSLHAGACLVHGGYPGGPATHDRSIHQTGRPCGAVACAHSPRSLRPSGGPPVTSGGATPCCHHPGAGANRARGWPESPASCGSTTSTPVPASHGGRRLSPRGAWATIPQGQTPGPAWSQHPARGPP